MRVVVGTGPLCEGGEVVVPLPLLPDPEVEPLELLELFTPERIGCSGVLVELVGLPAPLPPTTSGDEAAIGVLLATLLACVVDEVLHERATVEVEVDGGVLFATAAV